MDKQYYQEYFTLEREHWWFRARLEILQSLVDRVLNRGQSKVDCRILNAGIATGATTVMLQEYGHVTSLEFDLECCQFVREFVGIDVDQGSLTELPYQSSSFDLVCAFDVVEHIEDDEKALREIHRVLKPNGKIFLTVPAFQFLWSEHDVVNHHFRRYSLGRLVELVESSGFTIKKKSYFNFLLFPMVAAARLISGLLPKDSKQGSKIESDFSRYQTGGLVNWALRNIFRSEKHWLSRGFIFPIGVSAYIIAQKGSTIEEIADTTLDESNSSLQTSDMHHRCVWI